MDELYAVLGLPPTATDAELKLQYRRLSLQLHPDKACGDKGKEERFKAVAHAYNIITNPELRAQFMRAKAGGSFVDHEQRRAARSIWPVCWAVVCLPPKLRRRVIKSIFRKGSGREAGGGDDCSVPPLSWTELVWDEPSDVRMGAWLFLVMVLCAAAW
jgi:hypothetical protein